MNHSVRQGIASELGVSDMGSTLSEKTARPPKAMRLRYAGRCRRCEMELAYVSGTKNLTCLECLPEHLSVAAQTISSSAIERPDSSKNALLESGPRDSEVFSGDWPLLGGDFRIAGVSVLWPKKAAGHILKLGPVNAATARHVFHILASSCPPS